MVINNWFKIYINTAKGRMGERMLRRLRYELFDRLLRFPQAQFRKVKQAEIATMIKDEVEPLGGFIGDAFVQPAFLGGNALTALYFMLQQSFWLGVVAVIVLLVQAVVIPQAAQEDPAPGQGAPADGAHARRAASPNASTARSRSTPTTPRTTSAPISSSGSAASTTSASSSISANSRSRG